MVISQVMTSLPVWFMQISIYEVLNQWEYSGVFDILLPFLLIFVLIFGVLSTTKILGGNRGINLVISLVIGLMALRLDFVSVFFAELFPRFAVGLVSLIVIVILVGFFIPKEGVKGWFIGFAVAGAVIGLIVLFLTFNSPSFDFFSGFFWQQNTGWIIFAIIAIILIIAIFVSSAPKSEEKGITIPIGSIRS